MRKRILLIIALLSLTYAQSQELYFLTGSNFTKYEFASNAPTMSMPLQSGTGMTYEIGYVRPLPEKGFSYLFAVTLNNQNALAGTAATTYEWSTKYLGGQSALQYSYTITPLLSVSARGGVNVSTIIYGKQNLDGAILDLVHQKEFKGLWLSPFMGVQTNFNLSQSNYLSLGYGYSGGMNLSNNLDERLSFITQQIQFGIHFNVN